MEKKGHLKRFQKIINTFVKHGFGQLIHESGIKELTRHLPHRVDHAEKDKIVISKAVRFRMVLEELGPTFIKFGQLLSTRADLLPPDYIKELQRLQDHVPSISFLKVKEIIERELKYPLDLLFDSIDETPLAAASIGQVHLATLPGGDKVVVKVQRPNIIKTIDLDLAIMDEIAFLIDRYTSIGKVYKFRNIVKEFNHIIHLELNFHQEGRNAERFKKNFEKESTVYIPEIYWSYSTQKILTLEYVDGIMLNNKDSLGKNSLSKRKIVENLSRAFLKQFFLDGIFHGDPHPGNIGVLPGEVIYFLDFGITGYLNEEQQQIFGKLMLGFLSKDLDEVMNGILNLGVISEETDQKELRWELERLQEKYFEVPLREINFGQVLYKLMEISFKQRIRLPADFTLLAKTFLTLEGLISDIEPNFSIAELIKPFGKELLRNRFSRKKITINFYKNFNKYLRLFEIFPDRITSILERGAEGNVKLKIEVVETNRILNRLNNMTNRVSFSIVLASIIVGLCLMLQFLEVVIFRRFPVAEIGLIL
ncbi:MAG: AarF/ABC1/UbiB kinase family protein, partial [Bacillota bacterium]|nr:AarF/ABC1/UbiB kinase family protein [Bacillota bacterium]